MANNNQPMMSRRWLGGWMALSVLAIAAFVGYYFYYTSETIAVQKAMLQAEARKAAMELDTHMKQLVAIADRLAEHLGTASPQTVEDAIRSEIDRHPNVSGVGAAFIPGAIDDYPKLFAPYYIKSGERHRLIHVEDTYDYTRPSPDEDPVRNRDWFLAPIARKRPVWIEPHYGSATKAYLATYATPIIRPGADGASTIIGVVFANYSLEKIRNVMLSLNIGKTGYGAILSGTGGVLYHPRRELVSGTQSMYEIADAHGSRELREIAKKATGGLSGVADYASIFSGQNMWYFYEPIPVAGWSLNVLAVKDELPLDLAFQRRLIFGASAAVVLTLLLATGFDRNRLRAALMASLVLVAGTVALWGWVESDRFQTDGQNYKMVDQSSLNQFQDQYARKCRRGAAPEDPVFIPTGVFLQSLRFVGANNVVVTGYLWQDYTGVDPGIAKGAIFPEAVECAFEKAYAKGDTVGWYFKANLRERFDYGEYPFDRENVWLRIWHKDFNRNVVLVPDLKSYQFINPTSTPGIEKDLVLAGWDIQKSFFNFRFNPYNSNFGIKSFSQNVFPELYFNVALKRQFLSPFVAHLIPLFVVILILFFILVVQRRTDTDGLFGFNSLSAVLGCSALFFVVIFNHIAIRDTLAASRIVYLEIFYFVTYLAILFVSANAVLVARFDGYSSVRSKLLFFPTIFGVLYGLTFIEFF